MVSQRRQGWGLLGLFVAGLAGAASTPQELDRATNTAALAVDGVIRSCPAPVRSAAPSALCVATDLDMTGTRRALSAASSGLKFYGAWRSDSDGGRVYNWIRTPGGYVNVGVLPDTEKLSRTLVILTLSSSAAANAAPANSPAATAPVKPPAKAPVTAAPATPAPQPAATAPAAASAAAKAPSTLPPFRRTLRLSNPRMNGEDIRALQNRLMDVSRIPRGKGGDGWYGPVTEANVLVFQAANGLPVTGVVDTVTWNTLFSQGARYFDARVAEQRAKERQNR
ncbi:Putative peptidoglycan binding domain-containing protein [Deinococcus reticulitermitis]|uniref:Putative peptidoglycan binding domain-containing protein n=1 Tax=Deinococcus reticulitermitis TaxID=856736 RepID=A0A1H6W5M3_9DEIO|nr:peptidoglycan-binding domain-containing protein [Deinococcus reticulitermitis]SEJ12279.1 Putative peptidoglycan binding domain-containing protein [Deinococcus reticulitermitis]